MTDDSPRDRRPRNPLVEAVLARDREAEGAARTAIRHGQVRLAYQPVVQAASTERTAFWEGFARVLDETGRVLPAADFLPAIAEDEDARRLDCMALDRGIAALIRVPALRLAVNLSARSIGYRPWRRALERGLKRDATLGERLILEINEESAMQVPEIAGAFMTEMQAEGIAFALDDVGAGRTSLRHLAELPVDILKIDGRFTRDLDTRADAQAVVRAVAALARELDLFTVAEKVETAGDAALLTDIGIDCLQGYFFAAPTLSPPWADDATRAAG
ncbi:EAL domain, c-di-GMP-specific phosphodiesterase class I (or its enzymatically inactive variant) [Roseivivax marinus]|uniref:EAL domain-containing protein n=1 Tax=Roseivivax marinus TaxID=1379903 RepID=UPI0008CC1313|nr:EAL domain-containing protein [Roseivivax marinus]SEK56773.1 EAL domain, c-di-GMP-specific phosphodiesterase class I (or its enzymatically inactive variant) [Roseivivax marinus]